MKSFVVFSIGLALFLSVVSYSSHTVPSTEIHTTEVVPIKAFDSKKRTPLIDPPGTCIVTVEEEVVDIESLIGLCMNKRTWLNIKCVGKVSSI